MATIREKKHELLRAKAALVAEYKTLTMKAEDDQKPEDATRFDDLEKQIKDHDDRITRCERAMEMDGGGLTALGAAKAIRPTWVSTAALHWSTETVIRSKRQRLPRPSPKQGKGLKAARFAVGMMLARTNGTHKAAEFVSSQFKDDDVAKALNTTGVSTGGALIPQAFSNESLSCYVPRLSFAVLNRRFTRCRWATLRSPAWPAGRLLPIKVSWMISNPAKRRSTTCSSTRRS